MSDALPRRVAGTVTRHEPYGFYVDFGEEEEGLVVITMVVDDPNLPNPEFPPVGAPVEAALLGYADIGGQPRLSTRPMDLAAIDG
jgi:predicted RNA-binding protein with RPS1 domain